MTNKRPISESKAKRNIKGKDIVKLTEMYEGDFWSWLKKKKECIPSNLPDIDMNKYQRQPIIKESFRESYLNLDKIYPGTKIEIRLFDETFYITLGQLKKLFLDKLPEWEDIEDI